MSTVTVRPARFLDWLARDPTRAVAITVVAVLLGTGLAVVAVRSGELGTGERDLDLAVGANARLASREVVTAAATEESVLSTGDRVRVRSGTAVLELPGARTAELRAGSHLRVGGPDEAMVKLDRGDLLVRSDGGAVTVDGGSALLTVRRGSAKIRRSASLLVGVYSGRVAIDGAARSLTVEAYRQAAVAGTGTLPSGVRPLTVDEDDEWDRRVLGAILDLDRRLVAFGRGFEALLPATSAASPALFRQVLPDLADAPLTTDDLAGRPAGENLIGLTVVALAGGSFEERLEDVFGFREAGARWGLVAADQGLAPPTVIGGVEAAIDRAPVNVAAPDQVDGQAPGSGGGPGGGG
ncbi:MAG TPA: hypothetical protein VM618_07345, partial [Acidimicrobiia bacterium]|nr:hypothetical protein [Acidimicrobiia bacterium]